jgi:hypothetical protein
MSYFKKFGKQNFDRVMDILKNSKTMKVFCMFWHNIYLLMDFYIFLWTVHTISIIMHIY